MNSQITKAKLGAVLAGLVLSTGLAFAQGAPKPAPAPAAPATPAQPQGIKVPLKAAPEQNDWLKVCDEDPTIKKVLCYTTRDFVAENNQPVMAVAIYAVKDDTRRFARLLVPLTFLIPPGIRMSAEGMTPVNAKFQICLPQGCFVEGELNEASITTLKKGATLRIDMQNQLGQEVNFEVPLAGFAKAYDSAGISQEQLIKMQQGEQPQQGGAPAAGADDLKKKGEELLKQRQQTPPKQ